MAELKAGATDRRNIRETYKCRRRFLQSPRGIDTAIYREVSSDRGNAYSTRRARARAREKKRKGRREREPNTFLRSRRSISHFPPCSEIRRVRESSRRMSDQAAINAIAFSALKESCADNATVSQKLRSGR